MQETLFEERSLPMFLFHGPEANKSESHKLQIGNHEFYPGKDDILVGQGARTLWFAQDGDKLNCKKRNTTTEAGLGATAFSLCREQNLFYLVQKQTGVLRSGAKLHVLGLPTIIIIQNNQFNHNSNNNHNNNNDNNNNNNNHSTHCVTAFSFPLDDPPQWLDYTPFRGAGRGPSLCCPQTPQPNLICQETLFTWRPGTERYSEHSAHSGSYDTRWQRDSFSKEIYSCRPPPPPPWPIPIEQGRPKHWTRKTRALNRRGPRVSPGVVCSTAIVSARWQLLDACLRGDCHWNFV